MKTLDMKFIRYLNLFEKICKVRTSSCFFYNNFIVFAVPHFQIAEAIGEDGKNIKQVSSILGKKAKVVALPRGIVDAKSFILAIVHPLTFKNLILSENEIVIDSGGKNKAALIGRNKRRLLELEEVTKQYFGKNLRIS